VQITTNALSVASADLRDPVVKSTGTARVLAQSCLSASPRERQGHPGILLRLSPNVQFVARRLRLSKDAAFSPRPRYVADDLRRQFADLDERPTISFNRMAEWGADGRIKSDAPVYSLFVRHREILELG
jgi:hypothetical protein